MNCRGRESWQADGDILRSFGSRRAVAHPLPSTGNHSLAGSQLVDAFTGFDLKLSAQDDGELVKLRGLSRLAPAGRTDHACDADGFGLRVGATDNLFNRSGWLAVCLDARGCFDYFDHGKLEVVPPAIQLTATGSGGRSGPATMKRKQDSRQQSCWR